MFSNKITTLVIVYILITFFLVNLKKISKYNFLWLGVIGQYLLLNMSFHIYKSKYIWSSFHMYALMYVMYVLSFTCIDLYFYLDDPHHFQGFLHSNHRGSLFVDFVYVNISTISTIGYGDITPKSTASRLYFCYKIVIAIFMIVFLVSDIVIKTK